MPRPEEALPGRDAEMPVAEKHAVLGTPLKAPFPERARAAPCSAWAASGAPSASSGRRPACTRPRSATRPAPRRTRPTRRSAPARTGHNEVVRVVFDPGGDELRGAAARCSGRATTRPRACARATTSARSTARASTSSTRRSEQAAEASRGRLRRRRLREAGYGAITTEIVAAPPFYYAEDYHQQYLAKNPSGYCGLGGTGVTCPVGLDA